MDGAQPAQHEDKTIEQGDVVDTLVQQPDDDLVLCRPGWIRPVDGVPVVQPELQACQDGQARRRSRAGRLIHEPYEAPPPWQGNIKAQQEDQKVDMVAPFAQQELHQQDRRGEGPIRPDHVFPLPQADVEQGPDQVGNAHGPQVMPDRSHVVQRLAQGVVAEKAVAGNKEKGRYGKAGKNLQEQEQVQSRRATGQDEGTDVDADNPQHGQAPQVVDHEIAFQNGKSSPKPEIFLESPFIISYRGRQKAGRPEGRKKILPAYAERIGCCIKLLSHQRDRR